MIVVAGEALVDLAPRGEQLLPLPGGSPYNVAIGLGRLGTEVAYLGTLSDDGFGARLTTRLADEHVDLRLAPRSELPTTLAVVHLDDEGRASYGFYLEATAAASLTSQAFEALPDDAALHVSFGAIGLAHEPTGRALAEALAGARGSRRTSLDPNVRPGVFSAARDRADYATAMAQLVAQVDLVKTSDEDLSLLEPTTEWAQLASSWAASGTSLVVVTRGPHGASAFRADGSRLDVPGEDVEVVDTVGAGDAFTAGLLAWLDEHGITRPGAVATLTDAQVLDAMGFAGRVAAITCTRAGADPPRRAELDR